MHGKELDYNSSQSDKTDKEDGRAWPQTVMENFFFSLKFQ
jgi:hypothetical protein